MTVTGLRLAAGFPLERLAEQLRSEFAAEAMTIQADLTSAGLVEAIAAATARVNAAPDKHRKYYSHRALAELGEVCCIVAPIRRNLMVYVHEMGPCDEK